MGKLLLDIEKTTYRGTLDGASFSEYVTTLSKRFNLDPSVLWRNRKAVEYYNAELKQKLETAGIKLPDILDSPPKIGPEGLALLERISRVAPEKVFLDLATKSITGTLSRNKLREAWYTLSPVLDGKTARGRGTQTPTFDPTDKAIALRRDESLILNAFATQQKDWLNSRCENGVYTPWASSDSLKIHGFEMFLGKEVPEIILDANEPVRRNRCYRADAIAVISIRTQEFGTSSGSLVDVQMHGIEVKSQAHLTKENFAELLKVAAYFDYFWLSIHMPESISEQTTILDALPQPIGLIALTQDNTIVKLRDAQCASESDQRQQGTSQLAKALLASRIMLAN